jgi:hypothetical protein
MGLRPLRLTKKMINSALADLPYWSWKFSYDFHQSHRIYFFCQDHMDTIINNLCSQNMVVSECVQVKPPHDGSLVVSPLDFHDRLVTVYGLVDPLSQQLRYVGQTVDAETRYTCHKANSEDSWLGTWVQRLRDRGEAPKFIVIEDGVHRKNADESELFWIQYFYSLGAKLLNTKGIPQHFNWSSNPGSKRPKYEECHP